MVPVALVRRHRPRHRMDPRRDGSHRRRQHRGPPVRARQRTAHHLRPGHRHLRCPLRHGRLPGRPLLGPPHRHLRPQEALPDHPGRLPGRDGDDRPVLRHLVVLPLPLLHRLRHRRRVRGHQLRDRRADPGEVPGPRGPADQRQLLARRGRRRAAVDRRPGHLHFSGERRMAPHLRPGRGPLPGHPARTAARPGEPALAADPRPGRGGRPDRRRHREARHRRGGQGTAARRGRDDDPPAGPHHVRRDRPDRLRPLPQALHARLRPVHRAGVPLQRDHLRLRRDPHAVLRRAVRAHRLLLRRHRGRQLPRPAAAGQAVRHGRPPHHDLRHVRTLGGAAVRHGLAVRPRLAHGGDDDGVLVRGAVPRPARPAPT